MTDYQPQRTQSKEKNGFLYKELSQRIISCALNVHSVLGAGLLESLYEEAMVREFELAGINFEQQILVELKAVNEIHPVHEAQILSYLRATNIRIGLLINFNSVLLKKGIKRFIL